MHIFHLLGQMFFFGIHSRLPCQEAVVHISLRFLYLPFLQCMFLSRKWATFWHCVLVIKIQTSLPPHEFILVNTYIITMPKSDLRRRKGYSTHPTQKIIPSVTYVVISFLIFFHFFLFCTSSYVECEIFLHECRNICVYPFWDSNPGNIFTSL